MIYIQKGEVRVKKILTFLLVSILSLNGMVVCASEEQMVETDAVSSDGTAYDYALTSTKIYDTDDKTTYDFGFDETIDVDGLSFCLNSIEYEVENMYDVEFSGAELQYEIVVKQDVSYVDKAEFEPEEQYEENGYKYYLKDVTYEKVSEIPPLKMSVETEVLQGDLDISNYPQSMPYEYNGSKYDLPYKNYEVINTGWHDGYYLYGTITNYDAATYQIGDIIIENNNEEFDLDPRNYVEFLEGLDVPTDVYKVDDVFFKGEAYTNSNGVICRDYVIDCQMYGTIYNINYELDITDYIATITYELSEEDISYIEGLKGSYNVTAIAYYDQVIVKDEVKNEGFSTPLKIAIGTGIVILLGVLAAIVVYFIRGGRRKTEDMNMREVRDDYKHM